MGPASSRQRLTRRAFLRRAGLGAAGIAIGPSLLAACSDSSSSASGAREVRVFDEPISIDNLSPDLFEKGTGIFLRLHEYTDPAQYVEDASERLRAHHDIGADVVIMRDFDTAHMIESGWVRAVPPSVNRSRVLPAFATPHFDP